MTTPIDPSYLTPIERISFLNCESAKKEIQSISLRTHFNILRLSFESSKGSGEELSSDYPLISISTNLLLNNLCQSAITASAIDSQACSITLDCCRATVSSEI